MKTNFLSSLLALTAAFLLSYQPPAKAARLIQGQAEAPKVSEAEAKALNAIKGAPDAAAKLTAAEEFVKKYPKSPVLSQLAEDLAVEISRVGDSNQRLALADRFQKAFSDEKAVAIIQSARLDAYITAKQFDEAFNLANTILAKDPEQLHVMIQMTLSGTDEVKRGNAKYLTQTQRYGLKAIEIIEANKKPAKMEEAVWVNNKSVLPILYQQTAILAMLSKDSANARTRLEKAIALNPADPSNYAFFGYLINDDYVKLATDYKTMPEGKQKEEMLVKLQGMIDTIIDAYAHTVGLATGRTEYQPLLQQVLPDLTSYYKFRHNQSVEGLQQLIDKYKVQPGAKP